MVVDDYEFHDKQQVCLVVLPCQASMMSLVGCYEPRLTGWLITLLAINAHLVFSQARPLGKGTTLVCPAFHAVPAVLSHLSCRPSL